MKLIGHHPVLPISAAEEYNDKNLITKSQQRYVSPKEVSLKDLNMRIDRTGKQEEL